LPASPCSAFLPTWSCRRLRKLVLTWQPWLFAAPVPPPGRGHGPYSLSASHCQYCHAGNQPLPGLPSHQQLLIPDLTVRISPTANQEYAASSVQRADAQARAPPALMLHACHTA